MNIVIDGPAGGGGGGGGEFPPTLDPPLMMERVLADQRQTEAQL